MPAACNLVVQVLEGRWAALNSSIEDLRAERGEVLAAVSAAVACPCIVLVVGGRQAGQRRWCSVQPPTRSMLLSCMHADAWRPATLQLLPSWPPLVCQVVEAEREVLVWERRVQLEKEMQVGPGEGR